MHYLKDNIMDNVLQAKNSIINAKNIGILIKNDANEDAVAAALALFFTLKSVNKKVYFPGKNLPESILNTLKINPQNKIHLSLDEDISEVYYEKKDDGIDIFVTPKNGRIDDGKFSCKIISDSIDEEAENIHNFDLLFSIGIENFETVEQICEEDLDQLYACTIINIDNNLSNQNYGEINIIEDKGSLCQNISCLIHAIGKEFINRDALSFLLCGLTSTPKNIYNPKNMPTVRWLVKNGSDFSAFVRFRKKDLSPQMKMLEEALKTLDLHEDNNVYVSTIEERAMIRSGAGSKDLAFVVEKMKNFFRLPSFLLLWESRSSPKTVKGVFYSDDKSAVKKISDGFRGVSKGLGVLFLTEEASAGSAAQKVLSHILK